MKQIILAIALLIPALCYSQWKVPKGYEDLGIVGGDRLINGKPVDSSDKRYWPVVRIRTGNAGCSATVIGKRVLMTAAHCAKSGATATFTYKTQQYRAKMKRSPNYGGQKDNDIALGLLDRDFVDVPSSVSVAKVPIGGEITILGYGCTRPGGGGGSDGVLRIGNTEVTRYNKWDLVSKRRDGAALCYGDSGGPVYFEDKLVGTNSKGNIKDTNYTARYDISETKNFMATWTSDNSVGICGLNAAQGECGDSTPPPPPPEDTFTIENEAVKKVITLKADSKMTIEYVKTYEQMLLDYYLSDKSETPDRMCGCESGGMAVCGEDNRAACFDSYGIHTGYCYCDFQ